MSGAPRHHGRATSVEFYAIPEDERRHELLDGEIVERGAATGPHGRARARLTGKLFGPFDRQQDRQPGGRWLGGWIFATEVDVRFGDSICVPDLAGWRRERLATLPPESPIGVIPDFICEVLSTNRRNDVVRKMRIYHQHGVPHYWHIDPESETLVVHRHHPDGYLQVLGAERGQRVYAEPFGAIELPVGVLFGDDDDE